MALSFAERVSPITVTLAGALAYVVSAGWASSNAAGPARVGVAAAIVSDVSAGVRGALKPISSGADVFQNDTVKTGAKANAQLLFLDETTLSVGPNSEVTLDRFIYDPTRRTGDVVLSTGRGVFRFVSGNADPRSYQVKTPVATIGFRGTVVDIGYINGKAFVLDVEGNSFVNTPAGIRELGPGQAVIFSGGGRFEVVKFADFLVALGGGVPYPLFGNHFVEDPAFPLSQDTIEALLNEINSHATPPACVPNPLYPPC